MMPVALNRICRSEKAMGPFGSSTPSVQPPSAAAPIRIAASKPYRMLDLVRVEVDGAECAAHVGWQEFGAHRSNGPATRRLDRREWTGRVVDKKRRKQHKKVEDRESEQPMRSAPISRNASVQLNREHKQKRAADCDGCAIEATCEPEPPRQLRSQNQETAVDQDLPRRSSPSRNDRQHRDAGADVIVGAIERERPKMGRRPEENNEKQQKRFEPDLSGCRCPSDNGR